MSWYFFDKFDEFSKVKRFGIPEYGLFVDLEQIGTRRAQLEHNTVGLRQANQLGNFFLTLLAEMSRADDVELAVHGRIQDADCRRRIRKKLAQFLLLHIDTNVDYLFTPLWRVFYLWKKKTLKNN